MSFGDEVKQLHFVADHITFSPARPELRGLLMVSTQDGTLLNVYLPKRVEDELKKAVR